MQCGFSAQTHRDMCKLHFLKNNKQSYQKHGKDVPWERCSDWALTQSNVVAAVSQCMSKKFELLKLVQPGLKFK
jgi:hypothetical protein